MEQNQIIYGGTFVSDTDNSLQAKSYANFGLNPNARVTKFAFENAAKEGEPERKVICIIVDVNGTEFRDWINPIDKIKKGDADLIPGTEEYLKEARVLLGQMSGTITHYLKALNVQEEVIKNVLSQRYPSFEAFCIAVCNLLPPNYSQLPVDIFLEYQWNIGKDKDGKFRDKTYPTLPKNMKGGYFIVPAQQGTFADSIDEEGNLIYTNAAGLLHPFKRSKDFMESNKGKQQILGQQANGNGAFTPPSATNFGTPPPGPAFNANPTAPGAVPTSPNGNNWQTPGN